MVEKNPASIYGGNIEGWDKNKIRFINWVLFYNNLDYAYGEPPPKRIVANDWALDRWTQQKQKERKESITGNSSSTLDGGRKPTKRTSSFDSNALIQ